MHLELAHGQGSVQAGQKQDQRPPLLSCSWSLNRTTLTSLTGWIKTKHHHSILSAADAAKSLQSCPTLCNPIDSSPPGFPIPGILQARTLEWVAISFSNAWKRKVKGKSLSHVWLFTTPWTAAYQAPPSMGFSRQVYWSGVPLPSPEHKQNISIIQATKM